MGIFRLKGLRTVQSYFHVVPGYLNIFAPQAFADILYYSLLDSRSVDRSSQHGDMVRIRSRYLCTAKLRRIEVSVPTFKVIRNFIRYVVRPDFVKTLEWGENLHECHSEVQEDLGSELRIDPDTKSAKRNSVRMSVRQQPQTKLYHENRWGPWAFEGCRQGRAFG